LARLPLNLYKRRKDGGKDLITDHSLFDLLHNIPNPETTSFNWREASQGHLLLWGNSYSYIERDKSGKIKGLWILPNPDQVEIRRAGNQLVYKYKVENKEVTRTRDQIFHIPGYGWNGLYGLSMINMAREAIGLGLAAEDFGGSYFGEGIHPAGALEMDNFLGDNRKEFAEAVKEGYAGLGKAHNIMLLEGGAKYKPITMPLNDAQFLETRNFQKIEICGMYHIPPHKIAIHNQNSNYNNLEQENGSYVDSCLMHWIARWESAIKLQLLTEAERRSGLFFEFLVAGLLRGDSQARAEYYNKIFQVGGITPNQIRAKENMNPIEGGDQSFVMLNMVPLDKAEEMAEKQLEEPKKEPGFSKNEPPDDEKEPENEKKGAFKGFFSEKRAKEIEKRSIMVRDRIAERYRPLILDAAKVIVSRETKAIKNKVGNRASGKDAMTGFLNDFYSKFPAYIEKKMFPVLTSYLQSIIDESITEIGGDSVNLDKETKEYVQRYAERHIETSKGQMLSLLDGDIKDLSTRADEWQEKRPEKITTDETVRASGAAYSWIVFGAGMSMVLRNRGLKTCPYCKSLNGKRVTPSKPLISAGSEIDPKGGTGPMKFYNTKFHVPIHQGCDCYMSAV
jgi:HK97 family phage portal protein